MTPRTWLVAATSVLLSSAPPARGAVIDFGGSVLGGNDAVDFSEPGELDFDAEYFLTTPILLDVLLEAGDSMPELAFSAFFFNSSPEDWTGFRITLLGGPTFASVGDVVPETSPFFSVAIRPDETSALISFFDFPEFSGFTLGHPTDFPDDIADGLDWYLAMNGLGPGDRFAVELRATAAPEPGLFALLGVGLLALLLPARERILNRR